MPTLSSYQVNSTLDGDYNITMIFSDSSQSTQTIHFGDVTQNDLNSLVATYAQAYQNGLLEEKAVSP